jgi:hypothetical protein
MPTPHEPGTPHYPEDPDVMEARLIEEIIQIQAQLGPDLCGPKSALALRAASTEALGRQADRYETSPTSIASWPSAVDRGQVLRDGIDKPKRFGL